MMSIFEFLKIGDDIDGEADYDRSGYSVSLSSNGEILAIGAFENNNSGGLNSGHVRVYKNFNGTWTQVGSDIDGEDPTNYSGWSVSLSSNGEIVAIGSIKKDCDADSINDNRGQVRVYKNISGTWTKVGDNILGESSSDYSGYSVSLSGNGDVVAIGAVGNDANGSNSGHVRVYRDISGTWTQVGDDIDGEATGDKSGQSVSLSNDGDALAIGAYRNDDNGYNSGHVRIYRNIDGSWSQIASDIDGEAVDDESGYSVSLSGNGNIVAIGAPYNNNANGSYSGHVRVYRNNSDISWTQIGDDINGEADDDESGYSVSLSNDGSILAIGAVGNDANGSNSGHVRVYKNIDGSWSQIASDIDGEAINDESGYSVSLSGNGSVLAIGAYRNDGNGSDSGHVRVYNINEFQTNRDGTIDSPFTIKYGEKYIINHEITVSSTFTVNSGGTLIVSETGNIIFTGSGNLVNNGAIIDNSPKFVSNTNLNGKILNNGSITGDPYIKSANGKITKTPNRHGFYRLFENADIFINCEVDELDISESLDAFIDSFKSIANGKYASKLVNTVCNIARSGFWNKSIYISSEGNSITYNLFDNYISQQKDSGNNYFNVSVDKQSKKNTMKCINVNDIITETINISWNHSKHGMQTVTLDQYKNPQVQNGITFKSALVHDEASTGLFIKNYKAKYMSLNSLSEGKCKRIAKQLQKKLAAGESVFHEKSIKGKYEQWYTFKNNMVIKN